MTLIRLANEQVSMAQACRWAGMDIPDGYGNRKTWCPFGHIAHPDGGAAAAFRLYEDTNTAFCFACGKAYTPVSLLAEFWDCTRAEAAERLCRQAGLKEPGWQDRWAELQHEQPPDTAALGEALKTWCAGVRGPSWATDQFEEPVRSALSGCLGVLSVVTTARDAIDWIDGCKVIMEPLLREMR